jgi:TonB family protein
MKKISFSIALIVCTLFFYVSSSAQTSKKRVAVPESPPERIALDKKQPDKQVDVLRPSRPIEVPPLVTDSAKPRSCKVSKEAEYVGGMSKLIELIQKNLTYPENEMENGLEGKVVVEFVVNQQGQVIKHHVIQSAGAPFDREALRVARKISNFTPAMCDNEPIQSLYHLPITFTLAEDGYEYDNENKIDESSPYPYTSPIDAHDEYAEVFPNENFNAEMYKICAALPQKEVTVYLGLTLTVMEDGSYSNTKVVNNSANLTASEIAAVIKQLPKAKPAVDYGKPSPARIFIGFSNYDLALERLQSR